MPLLEAVNELPAFQPSLPSLLSSSSLTTAAAELPEPEMGCIWQLLTARGWGSYSFPEVRVTGGRRREGCQNLVSRALTWVNMPWGNTVSVEGIRLWQGLRFLLKGKSTQGAQTFLVSSLSWNSGFGLRTCSPLCLDSAEEKPAGLGSTILPKPDIALGNSKASSEPVKRSRESTTHKAEITGVNIRVFVLSWMMTEVWHQWVDDKAEAPSLLQAILQHLGMASRQEHL